MNCEWVRSNTALYVYDELLDDERYEFERHVDRCLGCRREVDELRQLRTDMSVIPVKEPSPNLLAASRMRLQEALKVRVRGRDGTASPSILPDGCIQCASRQR